MRRDRIHEEYYYKDDGNNNNNRSIYIVIVPEITTKSAISLPNSGSSYINIQDTFSISKYFKTFIITLDKFILREAVSTYLTSSFSCVLPYIAFTYISFRLL